MKRFLKRWWPWGGFLVVCAVVGLSAGDGLGQFTITKGFIGEQDIDLTQTDNAAKQTFSRKTSTGSTMLLYKLTGGAIPWDNSYTRTIRPLHIQGKAGTSTLTNFLSAIFSGSLSSATLSTSGNATVGGNLAVTGTSTITGASSAASYTGGSATISGNINANGDIVGDGATTVSGMARYSLDGKAIDTGTAAPTAGTWVAGDVVLNAAPTSRGTIALTGALFWRCITGGTPGTWEAVYPVFAVAPDNAASLGKPGMNAYDGTSWYANSPSTDNTWKKVALASW